MCEIRNEIMALSGVDIMANEKEYKSIYQVLLEIASVWDKIVGDEGGKYENEH